MMLKNPEKLARLEARFERELNDRLTLEQKMARLSALWREARLLNPDLGSDWRKDLEADLAVARAINGLPPAS